MALSLPSLRLIAAALLLAILSGCNPYVWGGTAAFAGPPALTGRNVFYHLDRVFSRSCEDYTYFDRPVRCVNDNG